VEAGRKWEVDLGTKEGHLFCERRWDTSDPPKTLVIGMDQRLSSGERRADVHSVSTGYILYMLLLSTYPSICNRRGHTSNSHV